MKVSSVIIIYFVFVLVIAIPPALLIYTGQTEYITPKFWLLFIYLFAATLIVITIVLVIQQINNELYAQAFLAATTVKILATLFFVLFFLRKNHVEKFAFAIDFFYIYFLNMAFEIYGLLRNLRNQNLR